METATIPNDPTAKVGYAYAIRSQADNLGDMMSAESATVNDEDSMVRPEFAHDADVNVILNRFGLETQNRPIKWGEEIDYTLDLQKAMMATEQADNAHRTIPEELKKKYPTYQGWLNAVNSGEYFHDLQDLTSKAQKKAEAREAAKAEEKPTETPSDKKETPKKEPKDG